MVIYDEIGEITEKQWRRLESLDFGYDEGDYEVTSTTAACYVPGGGLEQREPPLMTPGNRHWRRKQEVLNRKK